MPENAVSLQLQLTKQDYLRAYRRQFWRGLGLLLIAASLFSLFPILQAPKFRQELQAGVPSAIRTAVTAYIIIVCFLALMVEILARSYSAMVVRKTPFSLEPQKLVFSSEGMQSQIRSRSGLVRWPSFQKAIASGWAFQLYSSPTQYVLLPFRCFSSGDELLRFKQLLKQQLGSRARFHA
jgi:hypothetical protein